MDLLKHLKGIFIVPSEDSDSFSEYIDLLIERLQTAYRIEDKLEALKAIIAFSKVKKYKIDVGAKCIEPLIETIESNATSFELVILSFDCLRYIMSTDDVLAEEEQNVKKSPHHALVANDSQQNVEIQFIEIFMKNVKNLAVVLKFLEEYDFGVRYSALNLFETLVQNANKLVQAAILKIENGLSKILDLLGDSREIIRNGALVSLVALIKGNSELQKITAFENGFDLVFQILQSEDYANGGIVSRDSLTLLLHLLAGNPSNQTLFVEQGYTSKLCPFFDSIHQQDLERDFVVDLNADLNKDPSLLGCSDISTPDKLANIMLMLEIVRVFVAPALPPTMVASSQRCIHKCGLLQKLTDNILMASGIPHNLLTEAIFATGEIIRGCSENQEFFSTVMAPSNPPRSLVAVLLMSMLNEKKPLDLRYAILYFFQSYLEHNPALQSRVVQTLLSPSGKVTVGRILLTGLFSSVSDNLAYPLTTRSTQRDSSNNPLTITEGMSTWFAAVALARTLSNTSDTEPFSNKEQLLRVRLSGTSNGSAVEGGACAEEGSLMKSALDFLKKTKNLHSKIGIMVLLSTWLTDCPKAVKCFLSSPDHIPYLVAQINESPHHHHGSSNLAPSAPHPTTTPPNSLPYPADEERQLLFEVIQTMSAFTFGLCVLFNPDTTHGENLKAIVNKRLGVEAYVNKLTQLRKYPNLGRARSEYHRESGNTAGLTCEDFVLDPGFEKIMTFYETFILKLFEHKNLKRDLKFDQIDFVTKKFEDKLKEKESHIDLLQQSCEDYKRQIQLIATQYEELSSQFKGVSVAHQEQHQQREPPPVPQIQITYQGQASLVSPQTPYYYPNNPVTAFDPASAPSIPPHQYGAIAFQGAAGGGVGGENGGGQNFYLNGPYYDNYHQSFTLTTVSAKAPEAKSEYPPDDGNISVVSEEFNMTNRMNDHVFRLLTEENERLKGENGDLRQSLERLEKEQEGFLILIEEYEKRLEQAGLSPQTIPQGNCYETYQTIGHSSQSNDVAFNGYDHQQQNFTAYGFENGNKDQNAHEIYGKPE